MKIKVFDTPNIKKQHFLNYYEWETISHPKFPIPDIAFYHPNQSEHFKNYLKTVMNPDEFNISFFGSGDFHYLTLPILELKKKPFYLIMFDNHWDTGNAGIPTNWFTKKLKILSKDDEIKYDCASWLYGGIKLPNCKGVLHLGEGQNIMSIFHRFLPRYYLPEGWRYTIEDRMAGVPDLVKNHNLKYLKHNFKKFDNIIDNIPPDVDIYITIDKDVLNRKVVKTDYGQGIMSGETMMDLLKRIKNKYGDRVIGVDVCGEPTVGLFKKFDTNESLNSLEYKEKIEPALKQHSEINEAICEIFHKN